MTSHELEHELLANPHPPRGLIIKFLKLISQEAQLLISKNKTPGISNELNFLQIEGLSFASSITGVLAQQEWIDWDTAPELEEILSLSGQLEYQTGTSKLWEELFEKIDQLTY